MQQSNEPKGIATTASSREDHRKWIMDSGTCRHLFANDDLIGNEKQTIRESKRPLTLGTANGNTFANVEATVKLPFIGNADVMVLENAPAALSM